MSASSATALLERVGHDVAGAVQLAVPGEIDNVRLFSGQITDAPKLRRLCQGAEAEHFGGGSTGFVALDPTVKDQ